MRPADGSRRTRRELKSVARFDLGDYRALVDQALDDVLPPTERQPERLHEAMRYSVFAGGKRLRPILVLAAGESCGAAREELLPAACAVELIHTYSLIHDDLPVFDDDDYRRGRPANHKAFGEAVAILAGDALQTLAFQCLGATARLSTHPERWLEAIAELGDAAGSTGMAGGQYADVAAQAAALDIDTLRALHGAKTGALLTGCVRVGAILAGAEPDRLELLDAYGKAVGLAFQIVDDILDVEGSLEDLGKRPGGDAARGKATYPALLGREGARAEAERLRAVALAALEPLGANAAPLAALADYIVERSR
jgi:geranylgeranyl diphosphate synthase type II